MKTVKIFLESLPEGRKLLYVIRCLPPVWNEKILIVEDEDAAFAFLRSVLKHEGVVDTARNVAEALEKARDNYYDVIISDTSMPVMSVTDFYKMAAESDPDIGKRILFITGRPTGECVEFFRRNNLRFLIKPIPIKEIKRTVADIIRSVKTN